MMNDSELEQSLQQLSSAYLRLRELIPGAFKTPHAPTPDMVWAVTENALKDLVKRYKEARATLNGGCL